MSDQKKPELIWRGTAGNCEYRILLRHGPTHGDYLAVEELHNDLLGGDSWQQSVSMTVDGPQAAIIKALISAHTKPEATA